MKLKDLMKKASKGKSNTIYENIDNINGKYKVFEIKGSLKYYHYETSILKVAIDKIKYYKKYGFPKIENIKYENLIKLERKNK